MAQLPVERYSVSFVSGGTIAAGAAYAEMIAGASKPISVRAISVVTNTAIGGSVALVRAYRVGSGTSIHTGIGHRTLATGTSAKLHSAWNQAPTGYVSALRRTVLPIATGQSRALWCEDDGPLVIEPSESLLLTNHGSGIDAGALQINVTWEEGPR